LGDVGKIITGKTPPTANTEYFGDKYPFITPKDMIGQKNISKTERSISELGSSVIKNNLLPKNAVCVSCIGSDLGKVVKTTVPSFTNQQLNSIVCNNSFDSDFIYYASILISEQLRVIGRISTAVPIINKSSFSNFEILAPDIFTQTQIAQILTSFDDKIECLTQMNKTLEDIAQAIFKEWFVKDNLPKGWRKGKLGEEFDLVMGQSPKGDTYNQDNNGMVFYQGRTDFGFRFPTNRLFTTEPNRKANFLDTLVSVRAPVGDINMANELCCIGRGLSSIRHKTKAFSYTYYLMKSIENIFKGFESEGTVFGSINKSSFENIDILVPNLKMISEFETVVNSIDYKILENFNQIYTLTQLRDTLLPKLMSGEIKVEA
jgi:type I restriction enzyme S subunit